jgi:LysM repeat protein
MALLGRMKLKKLTIKAYKDRVRAATDHVGTFEAMFNPDSFSQSYETEYGKYQGVNSTSKQLIYGHSGSRRVSFKLVLDGTGVHEMGLVQLLPQKTVSERVRHFLDLTYHMNGAIHEPNFLQVEWGGKEDGGLIFSCRLASVNVTYTSFNRDGSPLRAELDIALLSDEDPQKRLVRENKSSPDLTHTRIVKQGDTLPLLTKEIYGSSSYYLRVAQANGLDDFRNLVPGQELYFPPLENSEQ